MKGFNELIGLLEEVLTQNYDLCPESFNVVLVRSIRNIERYSLVYFLMILTIQCVFLLINKDFLLPTVFVTIVPLATLFFPHEMKNAKCAVFLFFSLILLALIISSLLGFLSSFVVDLGFIVGLPMIHMALFVGKGKQLSVVLT
ncbi:hypothetical protein EIN_016240 [Entamoeba invadens IP1]|uniref:hypothetical protein n=1 Tax=Entamoeba invadens IP1 TaxID=370355 RepID=UPI0002C3F9EE|nr:hypothetical protein EIN_016240 [Entamoeba invadens IP1]ELP90405.1 hypothetical protein EIN_016240 [Entamoeba invadens IP1]|eukprot:XP_004257176.1 hypothetical protein EIN_016240 [Entamoeba invadens IP1]